MPVTRKAPRLAGRAGLALAAALVTFAVTATAAAQGTIRTRGARPSYGVELEPHLLATPFAPPGIGSGDGVGLGARATFELLGEGFIPSINDSVGIGVGLDWIHYDGGGGPEASYCARTVRAPNGIDVCVDVVSDTDYLWIPVVMQWNFWVHRRWSVFGEPGLAFRLDDMDEVGVSPFVLFAGGRFHITPNVTLTFRIGYPAFSFGGSFLF